MSSFAPPKSFVGDNPEINHQEDPSMELSNQRVKEAREGIARGEPRVYRVLAEGIFDLFHVGHMKMLEQAKNALGDSSKVQLIAGYCNDEVTLKYKGQIVMDEKTRAESLRHCKWVDDVIEIPWFPSIEFLEKNNIDFVAHDAIPYSSAGNEDLYKCVKQAGKFLTTQRTDGISTTDLIVKIMRDYDEHAIRNLNRGVDKNTLNLGLSWPVRFVANKKKERLQTEIEQVKKQQKQMLISIKKLTQCMNNRNIFNATIENSINQHGAKVNHSICEEDCDNNINDNTTPGKLCQEVTSVATHSYKLSVAIYNATAAALSYFNVFSYYDMYQQTNPHKI